MASARREPEEHVDADEDRGFLLMVRRGEPEGATELFRKYSVAVFRYADRMLGNRSEAEEVAQEVFLKMIARVEQYDGRASVASWLFAIAANASRDGCAARPAFRGLARGRGRGGDGRPARGRGARRSGAP